MYTIDKQQLEWKMEWNLNECSVGSISKHKDESWIKWNGNTYYSQKLVVHHLDITIIGDKINWMFFPADRIMEQWSCSVDIHDWGIDNCLYTRITLVLHCNYITSHEHFWCILYIVYMMCSDPYVYILQ